MSDFALDDHPAAVTATAARPASPRLERLLGPDGRCLDVAIDHGFVNEPALLAGIRDMTRAVATVADARPDAIQLTPGMAPLMAGRRRREHPALVLRTDISNVYSPTLPDHPFCHLVDDAVEIALALDAACVVANLLLLPGQPELHHQCVRNVASLKHRCDRAGMPLMVEPLVMRPNEQAGGYMIDGDLEKIVALVRQAAELGADVIKADPCAEPSEFHEVVETAAGVPVLVRGGGRASDAEILARTAEVMGQGAAGIVYGRNIFQHPAPHAMINALMAVVHQGASPSDAAEQLSTTATA